MLFQGSFKEVSRVFQERFWGASRKFQESFKGVARKIEGCFNGVVSGCQGCVERVQWLFEKSLKGVSGYFMELLRVFQGRLWGVPRDLQW